MTAPLVDVRDLTISFPRGKQRVPIVDRLSLRVDANEIVGLVGESGSGKSTVALALQGLVRPPGRRDAGEVLFRGRDLFALPEEELRTIRGAEIGMITQSPRQSLNPMLPVGRQISRVFRAHNTATRDEGRARAIEMLEMVGINDAERRLEAYPHELSGGMAQRALIAIALSSRPALLVADEPTSGLDVTIQAQFLDQMWDAVRETGSAVVLVSQDLGVIAHYCDRIVVLQEGRVVEDAPVRDFFREPKHDYSRSILALQRKDPRAAAPLDAGAMPLVEVRGLRKDFPIDGGKLTLQAVGGVDLDILPGRTLGLVGESGSGKTTVGRLLLRLLDPTDGSVVFDGRDLATLGPAEVRRLRSDFQVVFQDPFDALDPRWTVGRLIAEPLDVHRVGTPEERSARVDELITLVGLPEGSRGMRPRDLSSGQQQRVSIARALATSPRFIVLDEPTSALPPAARAEIIQLLADLQDRLGVAYLFISHDLTTVRHLSHDVAVLYLSQVVESGTTDQVFGSPQHPYSRALLDAHLDPDPSDRRVDRPVRQGLEGEIPSPVNLPVGCYLAGRCPAVVERCRTEPQHLVRGSDGRSVRCWRISEGDLVWDTTRA